MRRAEGATCDFADLWESPDNRVVWRPIIAYNWESGPPVIEITCHLEKAMLSQEALEEYRRMTPGERLEMTLAMMRENMPYFLEGPPEVVRRRFELIRKENDERNERLLAAFARTKRQP